MGSRRQPSSLGMRRGPGARPSSSSQMAPPSSGPSIPPPSRLAGGPPTHERLTRQPSHHNRAQASSRGPALPYQHASSQPGGHAGPHIQGYPQTHGPVHGPGGFHIGPGGNGPMMSSSSGGQPYPRAGHSHQKTDTEKYWDTVLNRSGQGPDLQRQDSVPLPGAQQSRTYSSNLHARGPPVALYSGQDRMTSPVHVPHHLPAPASSSGAPMAALSHPPPQMGPAGLGIQGQRGKYKCPHCEASYESKLDVRWHISQEHKAKAIVDKYPCKVASCDKVFTHRSSRCRHEKQAHSDE